MTKSPLDLAAEGLYRELDSLDGDISKLPKITHPVALLYTFQAMVDNGGFRYPMENDFPRNPPYSIFADAYRRIGASNAAEALEQAVALFPFEKPECDLNARNEFFDSLGEDEFENSEFSKLSDRVCGDESIWTRMDEYVAKHNKEFARFITQ